MRGLKQPLLHLENRITKGSRGINSPDRKWKAIGQRRHDLFIERAINFEPNRDVKQHFPIGQDPREK